MRLQVRGVQWRIGSHSFAVSVFPQLPLTKFIGNLKSVTARRLRDELLECVAQLYRKPVFWNESYFIASCGGVTVSVLRRILSSKILSIPALQSVNPPQGSWLSSRR
ncbi:MAG: hypothetical protein BRC58_06570 [Cyanobacteria bacterium QS_8_64_29]|nr:MAG: hypothetical protein BRC58_06570 [Cyanobacteria bacterium QS_8_64_29]